MVLGIVLIVLGTLFVVLALVAAARTVLLGAAKPDAAGADLSKFDPEKWAKLVEAITNFVKAAPQWLLLALIGAGLVAWGGSML